MTDLYKICCNQIINNMYKFFTSVNKTPPICSLTLSLYFISSTGNCLTGTAETDHCCFSVGAGRSRPLESSDSLPHSAHNCH